MHNHTWTDFNDQLSFIPSDYPVGCIRICIDHDAGETRLDKEQFESLVIQIREKMGW